MEHEIEAVPYASAKKTPFTITSVNQEVNSNSGIYKIGDQHFYRQKELLYNAVSV